MNGDFSQLNYKDVIDMYLKTTNHKNKDILSLKKIQKYMEKDDLSLKETIELLMKMCKKSYNTDTICKKFKEWKTDSELFNVLVQKIPKLADLPRNGWLSN